MARKNGKQTAAQKGSKRAPLGLASASVTNAHTPLPPEIEAAVACHHLQEYARQVAERAHEWKSESHNMDSALKNYVLQKMVDIATKRSSVETSKLLSYLL